MPRDTSYRFWLLDTSDPGRYQFINQIVKLENENSSRDRAWPHEFFLRQLSRPPTRFFLAAPENDPNSLCGYLLALAVAGEATIITFMVDSSCQGCGVGAKLLEESIKTLNERDSVTSITLEVRPSNEAAIGLYHKFGFSRCRIHRAYYRDNLEDAWVMRKEL
jgi:[ribosomal protein S18]-alanine N-acetyltransferase